MDKNKKKTPPESQPPQDVTRDVDRQKETGAGTPPKHRKQVTRENTNSRDEVRQQNPAKQGHPK